MGYRIISWLRIESTTVHRLFLIYKELKVFTVEELAQYDGSDPEKPIYLSLMGKVFDVSAGGKYYAKGGSYGYFSGKDASRAYVTGSFNS